MEEDEYICLNSIHASRVILRDSQVDARHGQDPRNQPIGPAQRFHHDAEVDRPTQEGIGQTIDNNPAAWPQNALEVVKSIIDRKLMLVDDDHQSVPFGSNMPGHLGMVFHSHGYRRYCCSPVEHATSIPRFEDHGQDCVHPQSCPLPGYICLSDHPLPGQVLRPQRLLPGAQ